MSVERQSAKGHRAGSLRRAGSPRGKGASHKGTRPRREQGANRSTETTEVENRADQAQETRELDNTEIISTNVDGQKKLSLPRTSFSSTLPRIHDQKNCPLTGQRAFSGSSAARIEIPRARNVEIKAFLTQRRVLKGRVVYPLPPRCLELKNAPAPVAMGLCWALWGASTDPGGQRNK